jgi:hypothetical protein
VLNGIENNLNNLNNETNSIAATSPSDERRAF